MQRKPTDKQIIALRLIREGRVTMINCGTAAYRTFVAGDAINPVVVGKVVSHGWAVWPKGPFGDQTCEITNSGEELLAENAGMGAARKTTILHGGHRMTVNVGQKAAQEQ